MYSLNQIRKKLNDIADAHLQIQSFGFGETFEVNEKNGPLQYPLMYVVPTGSNISGKVLNISFTLLFMDRIHPDGSNKDEVSSDQLLIATDIISELSNPDYNEDFTVSDSNNLDPFTERFADDVTGWSADITIEVAYSRDRCSIPQTSSSSSETNACSPVTIYYSNGSSVVTIKDSGSSYSIAKHTIYKSNGSTVYANPEFNVNTTLEAVSITTAEGAIITKEAGESYACTPELSRIYAYPPPTGQTVSYATRDDAWVQQNYFNALSTSGKLVTLSTFFILRENNAFGNTNRFTDSLGAALYGSGNAAITNYVIDHYTGLGWYRIYQTAGLWATAIAAAAASAQGGLSSWFIPNLHQRLSILNFSVTGGNSNFAPFNLATAPDNWTSTTNETTTTSALRVVPGSFWDSRAKASFSYTYLLCRKHY